MISVLRNRSETLVEVERLVDGRCDSCEQGTCTCDPFIAWLLFEQRPCRNASQDDRTHDKDNPPRTEVL